MTEPTLNHPPTFNCPTCRVEPTLSQDVLEVVPAWGVELVKLIELQSMINKTLYREIEEIMERVASLEASISITATADYVDEKLAALEPRGPHD